ncbi:MAG: copper amine oxidase N-terminal domain-containing protein [Cytophagales bacterium]|nr:copper amine oxidase N-terminal domain-containing protein [Armatimonadota bacterium]
MKATRNQEKFIRASAASALALMGWGGTAAASAQSYGNAPRVTVNNEAVAFTGQPPLSQAGRVLVPLRGVLEKLGAYVQYDAQARTVSAIKGNLNLSLPLGGQQATVNGRAVTLDVPAQTINGSTLVPLRFVAESLGARVNFDAGSNTVAINTTSGGPQVQPPIASGDNGVGAGATTGTVVTVSANQTPQRIVVRPQNAASGANRTIPLAPGAPITLRRSGGATTPVTISRIGVGDRVSVRVNDRGVAQSVEILARRDQGASSAGIFRGRFSSATRQGNRYIIRTDDSRSIEVAAGVPVVIDGRRVRIQDLRAGDPVTIPVNQSNGRGTRIVVSINP